MRRLCCLSCAFIMANAMLVLSIPCCHAATPETEEWVNLYNLTGFDSLEIVRLSPDGSLACVYGPEGYAFDLWDVRNETMLRTLYIGGVVTDLEFSPDSSMIAVGRGGGFESTGLVVINASDWTEVPDSHLHTMNRTGDLGWSPDGSRIALGTWEGEVLLIDTATWKVIDQRAFPDAGEIMSIAYSPDGRSIAFLPSNGTCTILDADTFDARRVLDNQARHFGSGLSWSADGDLLCCPSSTGDVTIYNTTNFKVIKWFQLQSACFSPTRDYLVVGYGVGEAETLYLTNWTRAGFFNGVVGPLDLMSWSLDGNSLALASSEDSTVRVFVDVLSPSYDRPPRVIIDSPGQDEVVPSAGAIFRGRAEDDGAIAFVMARLDDSPWEMTNGTTAWEWTPDLGGLPDGRHELRVMAHDGIQFSRAATVAFILEVQPAQDRPPWVTVRFPPSGYSTERPFPAYGFCGDDGEVERVEVSFAGSTVTVTPDGLGFWECTVPVEGVTDGTHIVAVRAFDGGQWSPFVNVSVVLDRGPAGPRPPVVIIASPSDQTHVHGTVGFIGTVLPPEPRGIVVVEVGGALTLLAEGYSNWSCQVDLSRLEPGPHVVQVWAFDGVLSSTKVGVTVLVEERSTVDVLVRTPANDSQISGLVPCAGEVTGTDAVYVVYLRVDGSQPIAINGTSEWSHDLDTTLLGDGPHRLEFWATHPGGMSNVRVVYVVVDNRGLDSPPTVSITSPANHSRIGGVVRIEGTATDDGSLELVLLRVDDGEWTVVQGTANWSLELDTERLTAGTHKVHVRAFDGGQYSSMAFNEYQVTEDGKVPYDGSSIWIALVIVLILAIVLSFLRIRGRGRRST